MKRKKEKQTKKRNWEIYFVCFVRYRLVVEETQHRAIVSCCLIIFYPSNPTLTNTHLHTHPHTHTHTHTVSTDAWALRGSFLNERVCVWRNVCLQQCLSFVVWQLRLIIPDKMSPKKIAVFLNLDFCQSFTWRSCSVF